ncbi:DNA polymerase III subunit gamma and tau [Cellulomonas sp. ACRRI]|uniref:DNA polymerase III subunit gamma and tau n=1 Tax=Cellulomonas sp. ACRRI TaxID=2918188 RepID=UPI001EF25A05|nr:DNA polymerase III subunit gamma and tau [Cellulomonas sp. ACRRI]MCG7288125.1 DNA polymerase III subunit gamma and tau [Cellulomonas sp. ACRRI]
MTTALYRRYRPETFAEVVGQDHVTAPLRQALRSGQTNHAYLFSGPRGCGKTTSARILARCLNCAQGPTDTPCGVCESCVELARGGPGSLDVVEIDAASHGGVDDARDLRERATFAPARDRYKVFILDEAHMVSPQGFNALLKIVEEPPEHVKFIFATTEPDKVIGTIRSRTHHYPFRLVPPDVMVGYLDQLCTAEGVRVGSGVLPLVVRAGGGSVRDSLSVLDQLIAGSGPEGLGYEDAVALLGYTHASLLDDLVDAISARDGASAFRVVERVISTGHEPRRFVEDLLERLRDLIVLAASGDAAAAVLRDVPGDQMTRMQQQAAHLGAAELSRSADLVNAALSEMTGATSPRLHLELLMARLLLPALDDSAAGLGARVDRLEREGVRVASGPGAGGAAVVGAVAAAPAFAPAAPVERVAVVTPSPSPAPEVREAGAALRAVADEAPGSGPTGAGDEGGAPADGAARPGDPGEAPATGPAVAGERGAAEGQGAADGRAAAVERAVADERGPVAEPAVAATPSRPVGPAAEPAVAPAPTAPAAHDVPTAEPVAPAERPAGAPGGGDTEMLRRRWPEVLETLGRLKKTTWVLISQNAQVVELDATTLKLGFGAPGLASAFRAGSHADLVQQAVRETLGFSVKVEPVLSGGAGAAPARPGPGAAGPAPAARGGGAPSTAEAAASWDAPAARPAPVPASSASPVESARSSHGTPGGAPSGAEASADAEDPDAADPWSSATVTRPDDTDGPDGSGAAEVQGGDDPRSGAEADADADADGQSRRGTDGEELDGSATDVADRRGAGTRSGPPPGDASDHRAPAPAGPGTTTSPAPGPAVAVGDDGWPVVAPLGGARGATSPDGGSTAPGAARATDEDGPATATGAATAAGPALADARASAAGGARATVEAPAPGRADGSDPVGDSAGAGDRRRPAAESHPAVGGAATDRQAARAPGAGRAAARPAPTDPGAPPPWDHPDDPGAPEPPDDDWARDVPLPPDPGPDPYAASTRSDAASGPAPTSTSGADRVRAAARAAAAGGGSVAAAAPRVSWADDEPSMDDPDIGSSTLSGIPLLAQALGATVIDEPVDEGY